MRYALSNSSKGRSAELGTKVSFATMTTRRHYSFSIIFNDVAHPLGN